MKTPVLETERLILRPLTVADAEEVFNNWTSDSVVAKYMRWSVHKTPEVTRQWLAQEEANVDKPTLYDWGFVLKETGELIGSGGLSSADGKTFELGYNIMRKYWNQGLTTEAAKAIIDFGRRQLGIKKFFACHAKENVASGRVMQKVGFVYYKDGIHTSLDGTRTYEAREYILEIKD